MSSDKRVCYEIKIFLYFSSRSFNNIQSSRKDINEIITLFSRQICVFPSKTLSRYIQFVPTLFLSLTASLSVPYSVSFSRAPKLKYIIMCSSRQRGKLRIHALKCSVHSRHLTANPPLNFVCTHTKNSQLQSQLVYS
jgi:hypothetical protein